VITVKAKPIAAIAVLGIIVLALLSGCAALNSPPVASFTCNPPSGGAPLSVSFNASGSYDTDGNIVSYQWSFGDGSSGSEAELTHTYQNAGSFVAKLTVTDNQGGRDTSSKTITVSVGLSPPSWIIGTWTDEFGINSYEFKSNDVIFTVGSTSLSFNSFYQLFADMNDSASSTSYTVIMTTSYDEGTTATSVYQFVKLTATSLNYSLNINGNTIGPLALYLQ
jgi:PKD repeat protein